MVRAMYAIHHVYKNDMDLTDIPVSKVSWTRAAPDGFTELQWIARVVCESLKPEFVGLEYQIDGCIINEYGVATYASETGTLTNSRLCGEVTFDHVAKGDYTLYMILRCKSVRVESQPLRISVEEDNE